MNRACQRGVMLAAALLAIAPGMAVAQGLAAADRAKAVEYLTTTRDQVLAEAGKLTDAQWSYKPAPDRWSVGEVVEHLALSEDFLRDLRQKTVAGPPATAEQLAAAKGKEEMILTAIPDRTKRATAPEPLQPATRLGTRAQVLAAFAERRAATIEYAKTTDDDLRSRVGDSPLGPLDGYQWLLFVGAHTERHLGQIREVKAHPGFPKATN